MSSERATGLILAAALQIPWLLQPIPLSLKAGHVALVALAIARPGTAWLVVAGLGPLAHSILDAMSVPIAGTRLLEQMVLAVITGAIARHDRGDSPARTAWPAAIVAFVAAASAAAMLPARLTAEPDAATWNHLLHLWGGHHFNPEAPWAPVVMAIYTIEAMAFVWASEAIVRRERGVVERGLLALLAGHAAAALLNIGQVWTMAAHEGTFRQLYVASRISLQYDRNAAGAAFAMVLLAGAALITPSWSRRNAGLAALGGLILAGLWLTGSRTAMAAVVIVLAGFGVARGLRGRRSLAVGAVAGLVLAIVLYAKFYPSGRNPTDMGSLQGRGAMAMFALRMAQRSPVFGVGLGTFYEHSTLFGSVVPENAHNNFLQILAEQGLVGFTAMLVLLVVVLRPVLRSGAQPRSQASSWLLAGVAAFLVTWLTGHPLLEPDAAFMFALVLGMLAGLTDAPAPRRWALWAPAVIAGLLAATVPFRAAQESERMNGLGLSEWRKDAAGAPYRDAGTAFSVYVPTHRDVLLPLRSSGATGSIRVEMRLDGGVLVLNIVDTWQKVPVHLHSHVWGEDRLDFRVLPAPAGRAESVTLQVGPVDVR